jgi:hypothetical protein
MTNVAVTGYGVSALKKSTVRRSARVLASIDQPDAVAEDCPS